MLIRLEDFSDAAKDAAGGVGRAHDLAVQSGQREGDGVFHQRGTIALSRKLGTVRISVGLRAANVSQRFRREVLRVEVEDHAFGLLINGMSFEPDILVGGRPSGERRNPSNRQAGRRAVLLGSLLQLACDRLQWTRRPAVYAERSCDVRKLERHSISLQFH